MNNVKFEVIKKISEIKFKYKDLKRLSRIDTISPPSIFIGSKLKYPLVNVGILSPIEKDENSWVYDAEKYWADNNFGIAEILKLRNSLLNSRFKSVVQDSRTNNKFVELAKNVAIAFKPVDLEIELQRKLNFKRSLDKILTPHGMTAPLKKAKITSNIKVHRKVDKVMNDELKASEGMIYLYKNKFDNYSLSKILSVGVLGLKKNKKLVPTRWSITATDDILGKELIKKIKEFKSLDNHELFFGEFLGNQYVVLFFPGIWSFELFELYSPKSSWNPSNELKAATDYEDCYGRKTYAFATTGGYYATRLAVLEHLNKIKKQAGVLVIRIETPSYWAGLGVWVVRESVRKTLKKNLITSDSKEKIINYAIEISKIKYKFDNSWIFKKSKLLNEKREQKGLRKWF